jgi:alpha-tubulin suppressor-like RCC1 family protein
MLVAATMVSMLAAGVLWPTAALAAPTVPGAPTQVQAGGLDGGLVVLWTAPHLTGKSPITGYKAIVTDGVTKWKCKTTGATTCAVHGLTNGQTYSVKVLARNVVGWGPASTPATGSAGLMDAASLVSEQAGLGYCAITPSGGVDCWGRGATGNGASYKIGSAVPLTVSGVGGSATLGGVASLASSGTSSCALLTSGGVDCWGNGQYGQLGDGSFGTSAVPEPVVDVGGTGDLSGVTALANEDQGYCALLTSGGVDCWGNGQYGQLGDGNFYTTAPFGSDVPVAVEGVGGTGTLSGVVSLMDSGPGTTGGGAGLVDGHCALLNSGQVACWGRGEQGQLGHGAFTDSAVPTLVEDPGGTGTLTGVTSLASGHFSVCALLNSGGVDCWGWGQYGQLGDANFYATGNLGSAVPVTVKDVGGTGTLSGVADVVGSNFTFCAVLTSSGVDCWGEGQYGQLGNGIFYNAGNQGSAIPVPVAGVGGTGALGGVVRVIWQSSGECALLQSTGVDCWGHGAEGELGNGSFNDSAVPVTVEGLGGSGTLTGVGDIAGAGDSYCATIPATGGVDCWGGGDSGGLGDGVFYNTGNDGSAVPVATDGP